MTTLLNGALLDGDLSGCLVAGTVLKKMRISTISSLVGTLTIGAKGGTVYTSSPSLNGVETVAGDVYGPAFFNLSDSADRGKVVISWAS